MIEALTSMPYPEDISSCSCSVGARAGARAGWAKPNLLRVAVAGVVLTTALALSAPGAHPAAERPGTVVTRTFPDGYLDDGVGSIYADTMSVLSFYLWHEEGGKPFAAADLVLTLELPNAVAVHSVSLYRSRLPAAAMESVPTGTNRRTWTVKVGKVTLSDPYRLYAHYPLVPWTTACVHVAVKPADGVRTMPDRFDVPWQLRAGGIRPLSGTMKLAVTPVRPVPALKRFRVWTDLGMYTDTYDAAAYAAVLDLYRRLGVNGLIEAGGCWLPPLLSHRQLNAMGFVTIKRDLARRGLATLPAALAERMGVALDDRDLAVNLNGGRTRDEASTTSVHTTCRNYYCLTRLLDADSPAFRHMLGLFREQAEKGFRRFFSDYEHIAFAECYCPLCRKRFAAAAGLPEAECLALDARALAARHTVAWYRFRTAQMGEVLQAVAAALRKTWPDVQVGFNDNFHHEAHYFPAFGSYGCASWAEDPRVLDPYLDFHSADVLGTGLSSIYCLDLYLQKGGDGGRIVARPVIPRVSSFIWVNWGFHCVFGRMDRARAEPKFGGLGADIRPQLQKLEIAQAAAMGAAGVEVDASLWSCDARTADGVSRGLAYVAEFEELLAAANRQDWRSAQVLDRTAAESPYHAVGPKGFSGRFFYGYARQFGFVQFVHHRRGDAFLTSVFNWDFYQDKALTVRFPQLPAGRYRVGLYREGDRYQCCNGSDPVWSATQLREGIGIVVPAGGICALVIAPGPRAGYDTALPASTPAEPGRPLTLYAWRRPPEEGDMALFKSVVHDDFMERMRERR